MVKDASICIQWFGVGCECRCRHCLLASGSRLSTVSYGDAKGVANRFVEWRNTMHPRGLLVDFVIGYSYDFPHILDYVRFRREVGAPGSESLAVNGMRKRPEGELRQWLTDLRMAGITEIGLTFYGSSDVHDGFANRPGDYLFLLQVARVASECGIRRSETIFLGASGAAVLDDLLRDLAPVPPPAQRYVAPWDYRGRGKALEDRRATAADLAALPDTLACCVNRSAYQTEGEWIDRIEDGLVPAYTARHYFVSVWEENYAELRSADCRQVLADLLFKEQALAEALPSLVELAAAYGQRNGQRIYALRDLQWKWQDEHLAKHPELGCSCRYNDLASGVRYK